MPTTDKIPSLQEAAGWLACFLAYSSLLQLIILIAASHLPFFTLLLLYSTLACVYILSTVHSLSTATSGTV